MESRSNKEVIDQFLPSQVYDECGTGRKRESLLTRYCRKKYKCIIILFLTILSISQTIALIIENVDIRQLINPIINATSQLIQEFILHEGNHSKTDLMSKIEE